MTVTSKTLMTLFLLVVALFASKVNAEDARDLRDLQFDANVEEPLRKQMLGDLAFMGSVQGSNSTPLHAKIFGKVDGPTYSAWFASRIQSVGKNACGSGNAVACVIPFFASNKMWVTKNYTQFDHPQIARISVIFHEARHSEVQNGNWSHANCPTPFRDERGNDVKSLWTGALLAGQPACDVTPFGSYGSQTVLLKNIAMNCANCTEKVRADAEIYGNDQFGRIIDAKAKAAMRADFGMKPKRI